MMNSDAVDKIIESADTQCVKRGSRLSKKRTQILRCLLLQEKPISAYGLIDIYRENFGGDMPATSVYRILGFLQENSLAHKLQLQNKYIACSHISCDHDHGSPQFLICVQCKAVKEVGNNVGLVAEMNKVFERSEFRMITPQVEMVGICGQCQRVDSG